MRGYDAAELILTTLEQHPGGLNMRMLLGTAGITSGQYRSAYNWTLDEFEEPIWIKNWVGGEFVYLLPEMEQAAAEDWSRTIRTQVTRARREHNKIHMIAKRYPTVDNRLSAELARTRMEQLKIEKDRLQP